MPADQLNYGYSQYASGDGTTYAMRSDAAWIANTDSGSAAVTTQPRYVRSKRRQPRKAIYQDGTTFRTKTYPVFTATAYDALTIGTSTLAVHVPGETATVTYTLVEKVGEKIPTNAARGPGRADHS